MEDFATAQSRLLEKYGSGATSLFLPLRTPALRTHVLKAGAGQPLLLLHGGNSVAACWEPLLSALAGASRSMPRIVPVVASATSSITAASTCARTPSPSSAR